MSPTLGDARRRTYDSALKNSHSHKAFVLYHVKYGTGDPYDPHLESMPCKSVPLFDSPSTNSLRRCSLNIHGCTFVVHAAADRWFCSIVDVGYSGQSVFDQLLQVGDTSLTLHVF